MDPLDPLKKAEKQQTGARGVFDGMEATFRLLRKIDDLFKKGAVWAFYGLLTLFLLRLFYAMFAAW